MAYRNKEKERQNKKAYYQKNKERILKRTSLYGKKWYQKNRKRVRLQHKEYYKNNKERVSQYHKKWYRINKNRILQQCKKYYQRNKIRLQRCHRKYNRENKKKLLRYKGAWGKYQRKTNPKYRLDENMGSAISRCLKDKKAGQTWKTLVNYTLTELIRYLEKRFDAKMNWDNYGSYWVVDHIKPKSSFNYISPSDSAFKECWGLKNLQPLEKIKNMKKHDNLAYLI
ncbi:MAG: hypothetical protein Q8N65_02140 [bacterium]|nr:hypothetical protein [bacterium]